MAFHEAHDKISGEPFLCPEFAIAVDRFCPNAPPRLEDSMLALDMEHVAIDADQSDLSAHGVWELGDVAVDQADRIASHD